MIKILLVTLFLTPLIGKAQKLVLYKDKKIEISTVIQNCKRDDQGTYIQYYYIQVSNLSSKEISVSFKREMWYNYNCISCDKDTPEYIFTDTLQSNEIKSGDCFQNTARQYRVFSKMLNINSKSILTDFKITNVKIEEL